MDEILNIEWHKKQMVLKALNRTRTIKQAAGLLGISERNLYRYRNDYNIILEEKTLKWLMIDKGK